MLTKGFRLCHFMLTIPHARTPEVFCEMMSGLWAGGLPATTVEHGHNNLEADYARYPTRSFTPAARARRHWGAKPLTSYQAKHGLLYTGTRSRMHVLFSIIWESIGQAAYGTSLSHDELFRATVSTATSHPAAEPRVWPNDCVWHIITPYGRQVLVNSVYRDTCTGRGIDYHHHSRRYRLRWRVITFFLQQHVI